MDMFEIKTVKAQNTGYLVNDIFFVPSDSKNIHYIAVNEWLSIEGNNVLPQFTLDELKQQRKNETQISYEASLESPIMYMNRTFQADRKSQTTISNVIVSAPIGFETDWFDIDNIPLHVTLDEIKGLAQAILARGQVLFINKKTIESQIDNATTESELNSIVI